MTNDTQAAVRACRFSWTAASPNNSDTVAALRSIGMTLVVEAQPPADWTERYPDSNSRELYDAAGNLRVSLGLGCDRTVQYVTVHCRLTVITHYQATTCCVVDNQTGKALWVGTSVVDANNWLRRHYPDHTNPNAYWGAELPSAAWWKLPHRA